MRIRTRTSLPALVACLALPAAAQAPRCEPAATRLAAGWAALRSGHLDQADTAFQDARRACADGEAWTGLGYVAMRRGALAEARMAFDRALARKPAAYDALSGRGMLAWREGDLDAARRLFTRALAVVPKDSVALDYLRRLPPPIDTTPLPARPRPARTVVAARAHGRHLEVPDGRGGFRPMWVKAVNIGAALPGRHPSEFPPDDGTYESWLALVDSMGANTVRVYTIHPPHFYRALARWNARHPRRPLWLLHGVWTELPPGREEHLYDDPAWGQAFRDEMQRVVDLVHGNAIIRPRAGHASGRYATDVSRYTLGYITGREWEPYSVQAYAALHPERTRYTGRYVRSDSGNAVEAWLAETSDFMVAYEMGRYNTQRPIAYTNWPTLDPLHHPTETTRAEEARLLRQRGEEYPEATREFDNDAVGLDATRMRATPAFPAGVFASFHAYPYYPDFLVLDPGYLSARAPEGPSAYYGYLRELVAHHGEMPVVISEYGVPSSRGNAHLQPQGWHHGGHSEQEQATINARLTRDIHAAGAAGAGLFAIIDEWFKKNWLVIDFERPLERNRLWHNVLDAEQNYGVVAMRPGRREEAITIDGDLAEWGTRGRWYRATPDGTLPPAQQLRGLRVVHNEAFVHLALEVGAIDWARGAYLVGISTLPDSTGDLRLPRTGARSPVGLEFVLDLRGPASSRLLVDTPYALYRKALVGGSVPAESVTVWNRPFRSVPNADGTYDSLGVATNRRRVGRDGTRYPERGVDRSRLLYARQQESTRADWHANPATGTIEVRIPWGMLHVMDPSSRTVLQGRPGARDPEGVVTNGFQFVVQSYDPGHPEGRGDRMPRGGEPGTFATPPVWSWPTWETPQWHAELKPQFHAMREVFRGLEGGRGAAVRAATAPTQKSSTRARSATQR